MGACGRVACILGVLGALPHGAVQAAELTILTNQGATPGVRELAAAFERATGHKVTVIQEAGPALERRLASGGPADLIASNPGPFDDLLKRGKVVAGSATPFVLAGLGLSVRAGVPEARHQHGGGLQSGLDRGEVDRLFARL
jgi:molybdate transport system substrate-binding protein